MTPKEIERDVTTILSVLTKEIDDAFFCPRADHQLDRVLLGLTSKAVSLARATCHLVQGGFYGEAFGLSRSSVEAFLLMKFISNRKSEERALSYLNFFKAHLYNVEKVRKKHLSRVKTPDAQRKQWLKDAETIPNKTKGWENAWNMASEVYDDPREANRRTGKPYQAMFDYEGIYEKTSHWVHCGSLSLHRHLPQGGGGFRVFDGQRDDDEKGFLSLIYVVGYLFMICIISFRQFDKEISPPIQKKLFTLLKTLRSELPQDRMIFGKPRNKVNPNKRRQGAK